MLADIARRAGHPGRRPGRVTGPARRPDQRRAAAGSPGGPADSQLAVRRDSAIGDARRGDPCGRCRRRDRPCCAPARPNCGSSRSIWTPATTRSTPGSSVASATRCGGRRRHPGGGRRPVTRSAPSSPWTGTGCCAGIAAARSGCSRWSLEVERWLAEAIPGYGEDGEWYRRPAAAGHRQRLRHGPVQRRHRGHRGRGPTASGPPSPAGAPRRSTPRCGWTRSRPCTR